MSDHDNPGFYQYGSVRERELEAELEQMRSHVGTPAGGKTIAQLEAALASALAERGKARSDLAAILRWAEKHGTTLRPASSHSGPPPFDQGWLAHADSDSNPYGRTVHAATPEAAIRRAAGLDDDTTGEGGTTTS